MNVRASDRRSGSLNTIVIFILTALFALLATFVISMGVSVYGGTVNISNENYEARTALSSIANQARLYDSDGGMSLSQVQGAPAIKMTLGLESGNWSTYIYYHDGYIKEIPLARDSVTLTANAGRQIIKSGGMDIENINGIFKITVTDTSGNINTLFLSNRSSEVSGE